MFYQHGDVLIVAVDGIPGGAKKLKHTVLAEGEATGHHHVAVGDDLELREDENGVLWLSNPNGCTVTHEEHKQIAVPPGEYKIDFVKEYDHFEEEARRVMD